jgi:hypothetical protein
MSQKNAYGLTPRQERFALEVAKGSSLADAYRASYTTSNMKPETVQNNAYALAQRSEISARVRSVQQAGARLAELRAAEVALEIKRVALSDIAGIVKRVNGKATIRLPDELDSGTRAAVASFKIDEFGRIEYKFWDKNAALDKAAKILGIYEKDNKQKTDPLLELLQSLNGNVIGVASSHPNDG